MASTLAHFMVDICGESYDICSRRFEQEEENLPGIAAFYRNFEAAVLSLTKSNVLLAPPRNYVYGSSLSDKLLGYRMNSTPYPWDVGYDQNGQPNLNPPLPTPEDSKTWNYLLTSIGKQDHEDMKVLQMLWSWIGDYRRHTLAHIYRDRLLPTRDKITQIMAIHKNCLGTNANIIINRYKSQWTHQKSDVCNNLTLAIKNFHMLQNINEYVADLDASQIFTPYQIVTELIPTLQHDQFTNIINHWNHAMTHNLPIQESAIQPALEKCFVVKNSLNDADRYKHVAKSSIPDTRRSSSSSSSPSLTSPSKQGYAYAASSQDSSLPTTNAQLQKIIADAITANDQQKRQRSPSHSNQPRSRDYSRERSRDRNPEHKDKERRPDNKYPSHRETNRYPRRDQARDNTSMPRSPRERGDRSPSSDRKEGASSTQGKSRA